MKHSEVAKVLTLINVFDKRQGATPDDVIAWTEVLPAAIEFEDAVAAVKKFYGTPAEAAYDPSMTSRQLVRYAKLVRQERAVAGRKAAALEATAKHRALGRSTKPLQIGGLGIRLKSPDDA